MFLTFTCAARSTHGRQFDVRERPNTCFAAPVFPLIALRAAWYLPPPQAIRAASAYPALVGWSPSSAGSGLRSSSFGSLQSLALLHPRVLAWLC